MLDHVATLICLYCENMLTFPLYYYRPMNNEGDYLYVLKNVSFKFEIDLHQFNHFSHFFQKEILTMRRKKHRVQVNFDHSLLICGWL